MNRPVLISHGSRRNSENRPYRKNAQGGIRHHVTDGGANDVTNVMGRWCSAAVNLSLGFKKPVIPGPRAALQK